MSSHHFVKEGQEPALLILDADASDVVMSLLEWSPTVLVSAEVLVSVLSWGIKIDTVIAQSHEDITRLKALTVNQGPVAFITDGPGTHLSRALTSLKASGQKSVNIISISPLDLFDEASAFLNFMDVAFVNSTFKWIPVAQRFEKWYPADTGLKFHPLDLNQTVVVNNAVHVNGAITTISAGLVAVYSEQSFWLGEPSS